MKDVYKYFDKTTFAVLLCLVFTGVFIIFSASRDMSQTYWSKQLLWIGVSLIAFVVFFKFKIEMVFRFCTLFYAVLIFALLVQMIAGGMVAGTKSWVKTGLFSVQISEFIKIPLALLLAKTLAKISVLHWKEFFKLAAIIGVPFILIALQPDLGTAFMLLSFFVAAILLKKVRVIFIVSLLIIGLAGAFATWTYVMKDYQRSRIVSYLNPEKHKKTSGYQIIQSKIAIG
jgi:rod shape determining protein RodA